MYSTKASPEIIEKMKINRNAKVKCGRCGRVWPLVELSPALYIDCDPAKMRVPDQGGNGYNYNCPHCKALIYAPRW